MQWPKDLDPESKEYKDKFGQNLLALYSITTVLHFVGARVSEVTKSRKIDVYFICLFAYSLFLTLFIFSLEYFALERVIPRSFIGVTDFSLFDFFGLSISTLTNSGISPIKPNTGIAQIALYIESLSSIFIAILLVFVFFTSLRERYKQDLDSIVNEIGTTSKNLGELLEENSELTTAAIESWLLEFSPTVAKWLIKLRHGEIRAQEMYEIKGAEKTDH